MIKNSLTAVLFLTAMVLSNCDPDRAFRSQNKKKGVVAIVYSDLTKSIDKNTADRQKQNIAKLFQNLPVDTKFFLSAIDRGTNRPTIYEFVPTLAPITDAKSEKFREKQLQEYKQAKETAELEKLNASLSSYYDAIAPQKGAVSCITNKLNSLNNEIANKKASFPGYDIRVFFYSDMIEDCENSFDGDPLTFERYANADKETKHLEEIQNRIHKNFQQVPPENNLGAKVYIVLTSQDDKQRSTTLKTIWGGLFDKLGVPTHSVCWANGNEEYFWQLNLEAPDSKSPNACAPVRAARTNESYYL